MVAASAPPICATSASTVSPGANCSSRKRPARMISSAGAAAARRRAAKLAAGDRIELPFRRHPDGQFIIDGRHPFRVQRLAAGRVDFGRGIVDQLVHLVRLPAVLVGPRRARGAAGAIPDSGGDGRIAAILVPAGGDIERMVLVHRRQRAGDVVLDDLHLDAHGLQ
ncbi:hypothetical protein G6F31_018982 [Rhizopus arrhizus]|nr:hypothetical protein G6F31_018982 [Rhizopus arrhizus]